MNKSQKVVVLVGMALFSLVTLFPRWVWGIGGVEFGMGYHFLLSPPHSDANYSGRIDTTILFVAWTLIAVLTAGFHLLSASRPQETISQAGGRSGPGVALLTLVAIGVVLLCVFSPTQRAGTLGEASVQVTNVDEIGTAVADSITLPEFPSEMDVHVTNPELEVHVAGY